MVTAWLSKTDGTFQYSEIRQRLGMIVLHCTALYGKLTL